MVIINSYKYSLACIWKITQGNQLIKSPNIREFIILHYKSMILNGRLHLITIDFLFVMWFAIHSRIREWSRRKSNMNEILGCSSNRPLNRIQNIEVKHERKREKNSNLQMFRTNPVLSRSVSFLFIYLSDKVRLRCAMMWNVHQSTIMH